MGGLLTRLVSMRAQQDLAAKQGPLDVAKLVLTSEDATPEAREWAINSVAELADGISSGGKGKGRGGYDPGMPGGKGGGGGLGSMFKTVLSNLNPYRAGPQTRQEVKDVQGARPQRMFLTEDEKAQVKQKQEEAENKILLEQKAKEARQTAQINREENQKNYEQEFDRGVKTLNLSLADAAKRADDIVNKYREPTAERTPATRRPSARKQVEIIGPDGKKFTGFVGQDENGAEQLYKLGSNDPLDPSKYVESEKAIKETKAESDMDLAVNGYKEAHKIMGDLTASQKIAAVKEFKAKTKVDEAVTSGVGMSDTELRTLAEMSLVTGQDPPFGLSAKNPLRERYQKIKADLLISQGGPQKALEERAAYRGTTRTIGDLMQLRGRVRSFEQTAQKNMDQAEKISEQIGRTGSTLANEYLLYAQGKLEDYPELARFRVAVNTAKNEYARVVNSATGNGVTTDEARKEADQLINTALSKGSLKAAIDQMRIDMGNRTGSLDEEIEKTRQGASGTSPTGQNKIRARDPQGKLHEAPAGTPLPVGWKLEK